MKKLVFIFAAALLGLSACQKKEEQTAEYTGPTTSDSLRIALANQDSLLVLMNDVADGMARIKQMENILNSTTDLTAESQDKRRQIRDDIQAIQQTLQMRRDRLAELEKKLKDNTSYSATLRKSIETLKKQIADQEGTINTLRNELASANIHIEQLTANVDSLSSEVATVSAAKEQAQKEATNLNNELNTCYYALGSNKELKEHKLISTGFLRKTKVMPQDFEQSYFTKGDKRTLTTIALHAKKAKVLTNQPADSYQITESPNGSKVLKITNPTRFWSVSNFLIVEVD